MTGAARQLADLRELQAQWDREQFERELMEAELIRADEELRELSLRIERWVMPILFVAAGILISVCAVAQAVKLLP